MLVHQKFQNQIRQGALWVDLGVPPSPKLRLGVDPPPTLTLLRQSFRTAWTVAPDADLVPGTLTWDALQHKHKVSGI